MRWLVSLSFVLLSMMAIPVQSSTALVRVARTLSRPVTPRVNMLARGLQSHPSNSIIKFPGSRSFSSSGGSSFKSSNFRQQFNSGNDIGRGFVRWGGYYESHPRTATIFTAVSVYFLGDAAEQFLRNADDEEIDWARVVKMAAIGAFSNGMLLRNWYNILDYLMPARTKKTIAVKMVMDAFIWGPVCILLAVGGGQVITGKDLPTAWAKYTEELNKYLFKIKFFLHLISAFIFCCLIESSCRKVFKFQFHF